ncbi:MAG: Flp pilus assembly protein CpaB [Clostridia bacterium]|jgi:pilus assembly protein CpaB|nr:Flp pilus assembly protein CpaB [Clostridia bacterium]
MKTNKLMLLSAIIFSLLAAYGVYWYMGDLEKKLDTTVYGRVIVPKETIAVNTRVTRSMFEYKEVPVVYIHPNAVVDAEEIDEAITKAMLISGEQLLSDKLVKQGQLGDGLAYQIKQGHRALTIPINLVSGIAGLVKPGDSVDIIVTIDAQRSENQQDTVLISTYVLQNILVLAADNSLQRKPNEPSDLERRTLTLEVRAQDAPKLVLASEEGSIRLLLRSPVDKDNVNVSPASLRTFLQ